MSTDENAPIMHPLLPNPIEQIEHLFQKKKKEAIDAKDQPKPPIEIAKNINETQKTTSMTLTKPPAIPKVGEKTEASKTTIETVQDKVLSPSLNTGALAQNIQKESQSPETVENYLKSFRNVIANSSMVELCEAFEHGGNFAFHGQGTPEAVAMQAKKELDNAQNEEKQRAARLAEDEQMAIRARMPPPRQQKMKIERGYQPEIAPNIGANKPMKFGSVVQEEVAQAPANAENKIELMQKEAEMPRVQAYAKKKIEPPQEEVAQVQVSKPSQAGKYAQPKIPKIEDASYKKPVVKSEYSGKEEKKIGGEYVYDPRKTGQAKETNTEISDRVERDNSNALKKRLFGRRAPESTTVISEAPETEKKKPMPQMMESVVGGENIVSRLQESAARRSTPRQAMEANANSGQAQMASVAAVDYSKQIDIVQNSINEEIRKLDELGHHPEAAEHLDRIVDITIEADKNVTRANMLPDKERLQKLETTQNGLVDERKRIETELGQA